MRDLKMLHRKTLLISMMLAFMLIAAVSFANQPMVVSFGQITAVQTDAMVVAAPIAQHGQAMVVVSINANEAVSTQLTVDAVLKKNLSAYTESQIGFFSQVVMTASPPAQFGSFYSSLNTAMMRKLVVAEYTSPAISQVKILKNPIMMSAQQASIDHSSIYTAREKYGIDIMVVSAVLPNIADNFGGTAVFRDITTGIYFADTSEMVVAVAIFNDGKMVEKESQSVGSGAIYLSTILFT